MTQLKTLAASKRGFLSIGFIIIGLVVLVFILLQFNPVTVEESPAFVRMPAPRVEIGNPTQGEIYSIGDLIKVQTTAIGQYPFKTTELWINGVLVGEDKTPFEGLNPWGSIFAWTPNEEGVYSIVARAIDVQNNQIYSDAVVVYVEQAEAQAGGGGEGSQSENADVSFPTVYPPAASVSSSPPNASADGVPIAPVLTARVGECDAVLSIQDMSENEAGFAIYRQMLYESNWVEIATFPSNNGVGDLAPFTDAEMVGGVSYYVAAFNNEGETSSNLAIVDFEDEDCEPSDFSEETLTIRTTSLSIDLDVDNPYCYRSYNGTHWSRWPEFGFLPSDGRGIHMNGDSEISFQLGVSPASNGDSSEPLFQPVDLRIECWGWAGEELTFLGSLVFEDLGPDTVGDYEQGSGQISMAVLVEITKKIYPTNYSFNDGFQDLFFKLTHTDFILGNSNKIPDLNLFLPSVARMPLATAWSFSDPEVCGDHLEPEAQNVAGQVFLCAPYPGFHPGPGGINPQPYLIWALFDTLCSAGSDFECLPLFWWTNMAEAQGGRVYVRVMYFDDQNAAVQTDIVKNPLRTVYVPDIGNCKGEKHYRVQMVVELEDAYTKKMGPAFVGPYSNWVHFKCKTPITDQVSLEVIYTTLKISHADDGINDDVLEAYGSFSVVRSTFPGVTWRTLDLLRNIELPSNILTSMPKGSAILLSNGTYNFWQFELCQQIYEVAGLECNSKTDFLDFTQNNNSMIVTVTNGEAIQLVAHLYDNDDLIGNSNDPICVANVWTAGKTLYQWAATSSETYQLHMPNNGNAECWVNIVISAVKQ